MIEYLYGTWLLCLIALLVYVLVRTIKIPHGNQNFYANSRISSQTHPNQHLPRFSTKCSTKRNPHLVERARRPLPHQMMDWVSWRSINSDRSTWINSDVFSLARFCFLGSQQFYIYSIDGRTPANTPPNVHLDLPPKYEDVIKDPNYVRREVS